VRVIDRSQLILDIFALGARTSVAKAQVELAQIEYTLPRLTGMWEHLSRAGSGIGTRGPGETQLEVDRRRIRRRMFTLKKVLKKVEQDRMVRTSRRTEFLKASLVGYTNTGKSTLFNLLTKASVGTGDRLFETLDTTTRLLNLPSKEAMLLSDTVGFIKKLPHHLVVSFHATLECVIEADLVIHVADLSHPNYEAQIATVREVLEEIGAGGKQEMLVFNKVDLAGDEASLNLELRRNEGALAISALHGWGVEELKQRLFELASRDKAEVFVVLPQEDTAGLSYVNRYGRVLGSESRDGTLRLRVRIDRKYLKPLEAYIESGSKKPS
jgi:GTP-binding protein HflX